MKAGPPINAHLADAEASPRVGDDLRILARFAEAAAPSSATPNKE